MILIVDAKHENVELLSSQITVRLHREVNFCSSVEDAKAFIITNPKKYISGLVLNVKLSPDNYTPLKGIPTVLITESIPLQTKQMLLSQNLLDTVPNYKMHNCKYILSLLQRSGYREKLNVLIVDEEPVMQSLISRNIHAMGLNATSLSSGKELLSFFKQSKTAHLLFIDNRLKDIASEELIKKVRDFYNKQELAIVCLMQEGYTEDEEIRLFHAGANDCIEKRLSSPLSLEHFHARVLLSIRQVISYLEMQYMAQRDAMTGAFNRRYFSEVGESVFSNYQRGNLKIAVAMLDIDNFKHVNDTYGHPMGDRAIISLYNTLIECVRKTDIVSRFGGEEFCVLLIGSEIENAQMVMERIREAVEELTISDGDIKFSFTVSIGLAMESQDSLEKMVQVADNCLYTAKKNGKNRVVSELEEIAV